MFISLFKHECSTCLTFGNWYAW